VFSSCPALGSCGFQVTPLAEPITGIKRASIRDVARSAGVSISTVSRALRGYSDVSSETRRRVQAAALELGYTPDAAGRALKSGRSDTVAVFVSGSHGPALSDTFYVEVLGGLEAQLAASDLSLLLVRASVKVQRVLQGGRCDGVIALGCDLPLPLLQTLHRAGTPLVLTDAPSWPGGAPNVTVANEAGGYAATQHLLSGGRRRVAFIAETPDDPNFSLRRRGYLRAHEDAGQGAPAERQQAGRLGTDGGYQATRKLLRAAPFDAIFAANDTAAFGALKALAEAGRRVPDDVAVVGFDDIALSRYSQPPLSTLRVPRRALGAEAADRLITLLAGGTAEPLELPVSLIVRESSQHAPSAIRSSI